MLALLFLRFCTLAIFIEILRVLSHPLEEGFDWQEAPSRSRTQCTQLLTKDHWCARYT